MISSSSLEEERLVFEDVWMWGVSFMVMLGWEGHGAEGGPVGWLVIGYEGGGVAMNGAREYGILWRRN